MSFEYSQTVGRDPKKMAEASEGLAALVNCHLNLWSTPRTGSGYKDFVLYVRDGSDKIFKPRGFVPPGWAPTVARPPVSETMPEEWVVALMIDIPDIGQDPLDFVLTMGVPLKDGLVMEFGVFQGSTANQISRYLPNATIYGFDSFQGLPEDWDIGIGRTTLKETFDMRGGLPNVMSNVKLVKGFYNDTLAPWLAKHEGPVRLLHVDCDLYSSSVTVLETLEPRIVPGSIIVFDELINFPTYRDHELMALYEWAWRHKRSFEWLGKPCPMDLNGVMFEGDGFCLAVAIRITK
jgi:predicted O-methyltransferase YrrM